MHSLTRLTSVKPAGKNLVAKYTCERVGVMKYPAVAQFASAVVASGLPAQHRKLPPEVCARVCPSPAVIDAIPVADALLPATTDTGTALLNTAALLLPSWPR
jgi:hypothetical protein